MLNITPYLLDEEAHLNAIDQLLIDKRTHVARDLTDLELSHWGFADTPAWSSNTNDLHFDVVHTERVLSNEVVRLKTAATIKAWEEEHASETIPWEEAKATRAAIKEGVVAKLVREAPQRRSTVHVRLDPTLGLVLIGTAKASDAEAILKLLRNELGSFPALPMGTLALLAPQIHLTDALRVEEYLPGTVFAFGDRVALELPGEGAKARFTGSDPLDEPVLELLRDGYRVTRLGLEIEGVGFEVDTELVLRRVELDDIADETMEQEIDRWGDGAKAMQVIQYGAVSEVYRALADWMDIKQPLAKRQEAA